MATAAEAVDDFVDRARRKPQHRDEMRAAHERERWLRDRAVVQQAAVVALLARRGSVREAENDIGYSLERRHQGLLIWSDARTPADHRSRDIHGLARGLEVLAGNGSALVVQHDEWITWVWLPVHPHVGLPKEKTEALVAAHGVRVGVGDTGHGAAGFRATHRLAHFAATQQ